VKEVCPVLGLEGMTVSEVKGSPAKGHTEILQGQRVHGRFFFPNDQDRSRACPEQPGRRKGGECGREKPPRTEELATARYLSARSQMPFGFAPR